VNSIQFTARQKKIIEIIKDEEPITGEHIASKLGLTRATLRPDLTVLVMAGVVDARPKVGYYLKNAIKSHEAELLHKLMVRDFKSVPIVVREDLTVYDAAVTMFTEDVGTLFVVSSGGVLEGVVSRKDILKITLGKPEIHRIPVSVMMTRMPNIITTTLEETVFQAAKKILDHEIDALPIINLVAGKDGKLRPEVVGRFSKTNVTRILVDLGQS
jgi:CBS domain-containing protein